jgi:hypothetical protein
MTCERCGGKGIVREAGTGDWLLCPCGPGWDGKAHPFDAERAESHFDPPGAEPPAREVPERRGRPRKGG